MPESQKKEERGEILRKKKALDYSIIEGSANSVTEGSGLNYITPYALALGANDAIIGLLSSVPSLIGSFSQLFSFDLLKRVSRKKAVVWGAILQALMWVPLLALGLILAVVHQNGALSNQLSFPLLLVFIYSALVLFGSIISPIWGSWMRDLVGKDIGTYFGKRTKIISIFSLISMLIAGFILDYSKQTNVFFGFAAIFGIAFIARLISAYFLSEQYEPRYIQDQKNYFSFLDFLKKMNGNNYGRFVLYVSLMVLVTMIASPFFAVYLLKNLGLSYLWYTLLIISSGLATILFVPLWGKFADRFGNLAVLHITGYLVALVPALYIFIPILLKFSPTLALILLFLDHIISGAVWAGFNLATGNFVYQAVSREKMPICVAYSNIVQAIGTFIGATFGGFLATWLAISPLADVTVFGFVYPSLIIVFLVSAVFRFLVSALMLPKIHEVVKTERFEFKKIEHDLSPMQLWYYIRGMNHKNGHNHGGI